MRRNELHKSTHIYEGVLGKVRMRRGGVGEKAGEGENEGRKSDSCVG